MYVHMYVHMYIGVSYVHLYVCTCKVCTYSKFMWQCMYIHTYVMVICIRMLLAIVCKHTYVYWYHLINNNISQNNNNNSEQQQHQSHTRGYTSPLKGVPDLVTPWGSLLWEGLRFW